MLFPERGNFCILRCIFPYCDIFDLGNFQQHITCSTATGIAVGGIAYHFGFDVPVCLVSAGLCSFAGMLPDLDSDTSKSFQECMYLTAGIGCILTASRLRFHGADPDLAMLGGAFMFLFIRFIVATWVKKITVHRGMIHSIPMAILAGQLVFFAVTGEIHDRLVKAAALTIGYLSHLVLDEVYSVDTKGGTLRLKRSFGTALKWTNPKQMSAVTAIYGLIFCLGFAMCTHPEAIEEISGIEVADRETPPSETSSAWQLPFLRTSKKTSPLPQDEIKREATELLAQQGTTSFPAKSYSAAAAKPVDLELTLFVREAVPMAPVGEARRPESELPAAMQVGEVWNRNAPIQPAPIVLW